MKLTGKCLEAYCDTQTIQESIDWEDLPLTCQNALIIEFFDSVGIYINIKSKFGQRKQRERFSFLIRNYNSGFYFNSRQEAINEAIIKANDLYNLNNK